MRFLSKQQLEIDFYPSRIQTCNFYLQISFAQFPKIIIFIFSTPLSHLKDSIVLLSLFLDKILRIVSLREMANLFSIFL